MADTLPLEVMVFGEALVDFFPERPGIPLVDCDVFHRHLGGAPCNVAVGLGRLGVPVGLMTLVGPDDFGRFVEKRLAAEGVDTSAIGRHPSAKTGVTFVSVGKHGERGFLFFRHPSADQQITVDEVAPSQVTRARVLHVGSSTLCREPARSATWKAIEAARAAGLLVSTDPNFRPHLWERSSIDAGEARAMMQRLVAAAAIVKISDDELEPIVGTRDVEAGARALRELGATLAIVTLGARGCYFDHPHARGSLAGFPVEVVDSTGAGDAFVAGTLAGLLARLGPGRRLADLDESELRAACTLGNRMGSLAVTRMGATAGLPARGAITALSVVA